LGGEWEVRFGDSQPAKGWDDLCSRATEKTRRAFEMMRAQPRPTRDDDHYQLSGSLGHREWRGRQLEQWQVKVGSGARIWYLPDDETRTVWVVYAGVAHPKATEPR
jgi:mRNA-degrading endonuclease RelE of RelBE toxin-antitoxin system